MAEKAVGIWRFFGLERQTLAERLADLLVKAETTATLTGEGLDARLELTGTAAELALAETAISERVGRYVYSRDGVDLAARVVALLKEKKRTLALAESCTGGLVAAQITEVPGCSAVFGTGVVSYSCACKEKLLGVRRETLERYGAVSKETALEMARGVRQQSGASIGLSITGEAGPKTAEPRPVGTVYIALADGKRSWVQEWQLDFGGSDRAGIRRSAALAALDMLRRYLEAYPMVMAGGYADETPVKESRRLCGWRGVCAWLFPCRGESLRRRLVKGVAWGAALLLAVGWLLWGLGLSRWKQDNILLQEQLGELYWSAEVPEEASDRYPAGMDARFRSLYDANGDVGGWLRVPETTVDYPVMTYAGGYYDNHSFSCQYSLYGQPYFDEDALLSAEKAPRSITVYGKYARDEQMLTPMLAYRRIAFLREHPILEMNTLYRSARWEIFAVLPVDEAEGFDYARTDFEDDGAFEKHLQALTARSLFRTDVEVTAADRILLVSVEARQIYGYAGARLVIAARQIAQDRSEAEYSANSAVQMPQSWTKTTTRSTAAENALEDADDATNGDTAAADTPSTSGTGKTAFLTTTTAVPSFEDDAATTVRTENADTNGVPPAAEADRENPSNATEQETE